MLVEDKETTSAHVHLFFGSRLIHVSGSTDLMIRFADEPHFNRQIVHYLILKLWTNCSFQ